LKWSRPKLGCRAIEDNKKKNMNKVRAVRIYTYIYVIIGTTRDNGFLL
jgi:hypothetical protein